MLNIIFTINNSNIFEIIRKNLLFIEPFAKITIKNVKTKGKNWNKSHLHK